MKATIKINMDSAAFTGDLGAEAGRILAKLASLLNHGGVYVCENIGLYDINRNRVGAFSISAGSHKLKHYRPVLAAEGPRAWDDRQMKPRSPTRT